jgi:hypothetical protein
LEASTVATESHARDRETSHRKRFRLDRRPPWRHRRYAEVDVDVIRALPGPLPADVPARVTICRDHDGHTVALLVLSGRTHDLDVAAAVINRVLSDLGTAPAAADDLSDDEAEGEPSTCARFGSWCLAEALHGEEHRGRVWRAGDGHPHRFAATPVLLTSGRDMPPEPATPYVEVSVQQTEIGDEPQVVLLELEEVGQLVDLLRRSSARRRRAGLARKGLRSRPGTAVALSVDRRPRLLRKNHRRT